MEGVKKREEYFYLFLFTPLKSALTNFIHFSEVDGWNSFPSHQEWYVVLYIGIYDRD